MTPDELATLIARAADGTLTPDDAAHLAVACSEDAAALDALVAHVSTERLLHATVRDPLGRAAAQEVALRLEQERIAAATAPEFVPAVVERARRLRWWPRLALAAALAAFAGIAALVFKTEPVQPAEDHLASDGPTSERVATPAPVAVLRRAVGVVWSRRDEAPGVGAMLGAGWLRFERGTVQVEFINGAQLFVVGPAELRLDSESTAFLQSGKASAYVPEPARGFTLRAPGMDVVDLGTAFGLDVSAERKPEVHVFDGEVSITAAAATPHKVEAAKAVRLDGSKLRDIPVMPANFPDGETLSHFADTEGRERLKAWRASMLPLAADPMALLCYTFDGEREWSRTVTNRIAAATPETNAATVGAGWTGGRWPGKRALEFRSLGDRLRFEVPGKHSALTLMAWVRVDSLPNDYNSLLLPSHYVPGSLHWTLERGGELRLTMRITADPGNGKHLWDGPVSGPAVSNMDFGRWLFLATTYDAATGTVTHYRDGKQIGTAQFRHKLPAVLGEIEFGNWGADGSAADNAWTLEQPSNQRTRNFVGRLDEFAVLARVLPADEISRHYEAGMP